VAERRMLWKSISRSKKVNLRLSSIEAKLLYTWSIPYLDREGLMEADAATLKATVVPLIKEITEDNIDGLVMEIGRAGLWEIFDVDDTRYVRDPVFHERQNVHSHEAESQIIKKIKGLQPMSFDVATMSRHVSHISPLKKERKKFKEVKRKNIYPLDFEEFWKEYPNKASGKPKAFESWEKVFKKYPDLEVKIIMDSVANHKKNSWEWKNGAVAHATTWLNQGRWTAEFKEDREVNTEPVVIKGPNGKPMSYEEYLEEK